jgi:Ca2+-binding RTX toxin-like protein
MRKLKLIVAFAAVVALGAASVAIAATINGDDGPNTLVGTPHGDTINGLGGDDRVIGLGGNDKIRGGSGDDAIDGDGSCPTSAP